MRKFTPPPIEIGKSTHVGMRRKENQDSLDYALLDKLPYDGAHLLVVADGMGGASGGEIASRLAVEAVMAYFQQDTPNMEPDVALREAIESGAISVAAETKKNPHLEGMGTTCVVVLVQNGYLFAGHIGDSRLYMLRDGVLHRLSRDHSAVQRLVEAGILTEDEARNHPRQNVLARVLGSDQPPLVEILAPPWRLKSGDRIMLCSDGLHGEVSDEVIASTLEKYGAQAASDKLVELANANGGNDNITVEVLAYGPAKPPVHPEKWYAFSDPSTGFYLHACFLLLFFVWGYAAAKFDTPPAPKNAHSQSKKLAKAKKPKGPCAKTNKKDEKCRIPARRVAFKKRTPAPRPKVRSVGFFNQISKKQMARRVPSLRPIARRPIAAPPVVRKRVVAPPPIRQPAARRPEARKPVAPPVVRKPEARKPVAPPVVRKPEARKPEARKPEARKPAARRPEARKPAAVRPAPAPPAPARPAPRKADPR